MRSRPNSVRVSSPADDGANRGRTLAAAGQANTCFFRTGPADGKRKALLQITERCDLHCAHCFVSATRDGADLSLTAIETIVLPRLRTAQVTRLTLTGGEPFAHPDLIEIAGAAVAEGMAVGICTNGTTVGDEAIARLVALGSVHVNVSFDGFSRESHGRFRGRPDSFEETVDTARRLASAGLLQGLLSTPNARTGSEEYAQLSAFASELGAEYLLMNPLSPFGRGERSMARLRASDGDMKAIAEAAHAGAGPQLELLPIRFPNEAGSPLAPCIAGDILYVFVNGDVALCPYLVFAARTKASRYADTMFLAGNILEAEIADVLTRRWRNAPSDPICASCALEPVCGKGCPAMVVAAGGSLGERDRELCPVAG
jgi:radical SAM protein with 4Fe4S-binding SPASM domain